MIRGLYTSASGMLSQQMNLDTTSNNLVNAETTGYKKDTTAQSPFKEQLMYHLDSTKDRPREVGTMSMGTLMSEVTTSYEQGELKNTGNKNDVAVDGEGFFVVQDGEDIKLTRNGSFKVDGEGYLVTGEGYRVVGQNGLIRLDGSDFEVDTEGAIYQDGEEEGQLLVLDFEEKGRLEKKGDTMVSAPEDLTPNIPDYEIKQGYLEKSNVEIAQEMTDAIRSMRHYQTNQRMVRAYDEILGMSAREIGKLE